ncbi:hypothetical protein BRADI_3g27245v3 [Brachypodium distachyon]|uniref:Uncharacterized protein n=1 Tax=Brachypodium distachyon TaxID=15368 RepID=A0A0Q3Q563_BRADI|nr:hypothetical protein BRADI_3g27245v3 [Brachypodium distachyon]
MAARLNSLLQEQVSKQSGSWTFADIQDMAINEFKRWVVPQVLSRLRLHAALRQNNRENIFHQVKFDSLCPLSLLGEGAPC